MNEVEEEVNLSGRQGSDKSYTRQRQGPGKGIESAIKITHFKIDHIEYQNFMYDHIKCQNFKLSISIIISQFGYRINISGVYIKDLNFKSWFITHQNVRSSRAI